MKLDVYVHAHMVGQLEQEDDDRFVFTYAPGSAAELAIALNMPVRQEPYRSRTLHAFFQISLPEGVRLKALSQALGSPRGVLQPMDVLAAIGHEVIGRVRTVVAGAPLPAAPAADDVAHWLQQPTDALARNFLVQRVREAGVCGVSPKGLCMGRHEDAGTSNGDWLIKFDDGTCADLSFNEFWSMEVARASHLTTAQTTLAGHGQALAIARFDRLPGCTEALAFEDFCSLLGRPAHEKYMGSLERIVKQLADQVAPTALRAELARLFGAYLCANTVRNGHAHLKNLGVLYSRRDDVRLAPIYDMVTTSVYKPALQDGDAHATLAITLDRSKRWLQPASLIKLGDLCQLTGRQRAAIQGWMLEGLMLTAKRMLAQVVNAPLGRATAQRMLELWSHGAALLGAAEACALAEMARSLTPK